ncbi:hydrocephalus-inducing protein homolog isoform X4 [Symsagittifera roscoffensis]|uniref:hydrocephalus-inducing protein homolog isoform X4 n=1 Tax=Symsagittifera roscoffensis TaxID=84072 RepID=UPI00307B55D9
MLAKKGPNPKGSVPLISGDVPFYNSRIAAPKNPKMVMSPRPPKVAPSEFMREMAMSTEERLQHTHTMKRPLILELLDMGTTTYQKFTDVPLSRAIFQPFPSEIIFQQYTPGKMFEVPLLLRNDDKVPRLVKVTAEFSPYFKVVTPSNSGDKVAPGMAATYVVQFYPEENKDYAHELVCISEREKFSVPVRCIGARPVLDFPDSVDFGSQCPVRFQSEKTVHVRNIGSKQAKFELDCQEPFSVVPSVVECVGVGESVQVSVLFNPLSVGHFSCPLKVALDSGESLFVDLFGSGVDLNIRLDKNTVLMESTFISLATQRTLSISNKSDHLVHFKWKKLPTPQVEQDTKQQMLMDLETEEGVEKDRFLAEVEVDPQLKDRVSLLYRTFYNRKNTVQQDDILFSDEHFSIDPLEGDIFPRSDFDISLVFRPRTVADYTAVAFCEVTGRENRMPLRLKGEALGPKVSLSYVDLNVGNVYINSTHLFEVILSNKGAIDAIYSILPNTSVHGSCFSFDPVEGLVLPDSHQAITINFDAVSYGIFAEEFLFAIDGTAERLKLRIIGHTIGPNLSFNVPQLKFGSVSFGFPSTVNVKLKSESVIPFEVKLRVPSDGTVSPRSGQLTERDGVVSTRGGPRTDTRSGAPKEFSIEPSVANLDPNETLDVSVTLTSNSLQKYDTMLVVDVTDAGTDIVSLPIKARCVVPPVVCDPRWIDLGRCFLRYPYLNRVTLVNDSDLSTRYELMPQVAGDSLPFNFQSDRPKGIIGGKSRVEVPVTVTVNQMGRHSFPVHFVLYGSREAPIQATIECFGEGPVVHSSSFELDYGSIPVLHNIHKRLTLSNESLVPAYFATRLLSGSASVWHCEPELGHIPPGDSVDVRVVAYLDDSLKFKDRLFIDIEESSCICVELNAEGHGSTIVSDPPIGPTLDLKSRFCNRKFEFAFTLSNVGRRQQQIFWSTEGFEKEKRRPADTPQDPDDLAVQKKKQLALQEQPRRPHFTLIPSRAALEPGESVDVILEGYCDSAKDVKERIVCQSIYNKKTGKQKIIAVDVLAHFIDPAIKLSQKMIQFRQDLQPQEKAGAMHEEVCIGNTSSLSLTAKIEVDPPFALVKLDSTLTQQLELILDAGQEYRGVVCFDASQMSESQKRHTVRAEGSLSFSYKEHPQKEIVPLVAEVNFPNLSFDCSDVDFGCILNDTEDTRVIVATNTSPLPVRYQWQFEAPDHPIVVQREPYVPPLSSESGGSVGTTAVLYMQMNSDNQLEKSQLDEMQSEKGRKDKVQEHLNEGRSGVSTAIEEARNQLEDQTDRVAPLESVSQPILNNGGGGDAMSIQATQRAGSDPQGTANVLPMTSLGSLDTAASMPGFGRPTIANYSQISVAGTPADEKSAMNSAPNLATIGEVFDIMPLYGTIQPGESQRFSFSFYAHPGISVQGKAICKVEGGPEYSVDLSGSASVISYNMDTEPIHFGHQSFNRECSATLQLSNTGLVGFDFRCLDSELVVNPDDDLKAGEPLLVPASGFLEAGETIELQVKLIPGTPEPFLKKLRVQVAHFEPHVIEIKGEGVFPRLVLDLPREYKEEEQRAYDQAKKSLKERRSGQSDESKHVMSFLAVDKQDEEAEVYEPSDLKIQIEMEALLLKQFYEKRPGLLLNQSSTRANTEEVSTRQSKDRTSSKASSTSKSSGELRLPDYVLDFGHVILGDVRTHVLCATNVGYFPISFTIDDAKLKGTGFNTEIEKVKNLPGYPDYDSVHSVIGFDPRGAGLDIGPVNAYATVQVKEGPSVRVLLRAEVTQPSVELSHDSVDFGEVECGQCKIVSVQLHNHTHVTANWAFVPPTQNSEKQGGNNEKPSPRIKSADRESDKFVPMHLRKKSKHTVLPAPLNFELIPRSGILAPGQRSNVQVKFMPTKEQQYSSRVNIKLSQSSRKVMLQVSGDGKEPGLDLESNVVEFGPVLPHSLGEERSVVFRNSSQFPIEIYSVEFDSQYIEEERILRGMRGYDQYNTLLLPPRLPGDKLPQELLDADEEERRRVGAVIEQSRVLGGTESALQQDLAGDQGEGLAPDADGNKGDVANEASPTPGLPAKEGGITGEGDQLDNVQTTSFKVGAPPTTDRTRTRLESVTKTEDDLKSKTTAAGELEITPVSAAIARYLDIDLSPEGKKARNRRGVAIIIHGAPQAGKTTTAEAMAKHYQGTVLDIDQVVLDAITAGNTPAGLKARELCQAAGEAQREPAGDDEAGFPGSNPETRRDTSPGAGAKTATHDPNTESFATVSGKQDAPVAQTAAGTAGGKTHAGKPGGPKKDAGQAAAGGAVEIAPETVEPPARRLSVASSIAGESGLYSCHLPEEVLVEILDDRMQMADCYCNVVFDGLESVFTPSVTSSASVVLKAFNNRKYIFLLTLRGSLQDLKERESAAQKKKQKEKEAKLEAERTFLQEMDEDEYDALSEEQKRVVDQHQLLIKKQRMQRDREKSEEERKKRELEALLEQQRLEEEAKAKKGQGKKKQQHQDSAKHDKKGDKKGGGKESARAESVAGAAAALAQKSSAKDSRKSQHQEVVPGAGQAGAPQGPVQDQVQDVEAPLTEQEIKLKRRMRHFELTIKDVAKLAERWDRCKGDVNRPLTPPPDDADDRAHKGKGKKEEKKEDDEILGSNPALLDENISVGIPHIVLSIAHEAETVFSEKVLAMEFMPKFSDIMDGLGLGSQGPPLPPPSFFQVVQFPTKRQQVNLADISEHFAFIAATLDDPNVIPVEEGEENDDESEVASTLGDKNPPGTTGRKAKKTSGEAMAAKAVSAAGQKEKASAKGSKGKRGKVGTGELDRDEESQQSAKLNKFRWVIDANSEVVLRLRFTSNDIGQFDQTLNFEIVGTKRRYQLFCRGTCSFPHISREPRVVFPNRKKTVKKDEIVNKKYVMSPNSEYYEFGPLLCGKSREAYLDGRYPENMECLNITNTSAMQAQLAVTFMNDTKGETFLFHPSTMDLKPGESQSLRIWAYPKSPGLVKDTLVCCVKENPEPLTFKVQCTGVRPEVEMDKKEFKFEKVLLHRKDSRVIYIKNTSLLPVAWRLNGVEALGEDFSMSQEQGIIDPKKEFPLTCHFRGLKPTNVRKMIRLEVSDKDQIMGLVQLENLQITAEAYDVALDMSFPKGTEGGIDFGTNRVGETVKQTLSLKNKGKYDCGFLLTVEHEGPYASEMDKLFQVYPAKGSLLPNDRPTTVQITFVSSSEVQIDNLPLIKCNIMDPNLGPSGETIACIPIKIAVRALYSRYALLPQTDIDFGSVIVNSKKQLQFAIENKGEFEFKFNISKPTPEDQFLPTNSKGKSDSFKAGRSVETTSATARSANNKSALSKSTGKNGDMNAMGPGASSGPAIQTLAGAKLLTGPFTINPAFGVVLPKAQQVIQVECIPDAVCRLDEEFAIDISDREPMDHPEGVPYHIVADAVVPGFSTEDTQSIFEEHLLCQSLALFLKTNRVEHMQGIFCEGENKFVFLNVVVGKTAKARFKITNPHKVKCEVSFVITSGNSSSGGNASPSKKSNSPDVFDMEMKKALIQPHSSYSAEVTFRPTSMSQFWGSFEAVVEGLPTSLSQKFKPLSFELFGEGNLPKVSVLKPSVKNKKGLPVLMYRRLLIGQEQKQQIVLVNDGNLKSTIFVDLVDESGVFDIQQLSKNESVYEAGEESTPHKFGLILNVGEQASFDVLFSPIDAVRFFGSVKVSLVDNPFEDASIVLLGEGYMEDITLENVHTVKDDSLSASAFSAANQNSEDEDESDNDVIDDSDAAVTPVDDKSRSRSPSLASVRLGEQRASNSHSTSQFLTPLLPPSGSDGGKRDSLHAEMFSHLFLYNHLGFGNVFVGAKRSLVFSLVNHSTCCYRFSLPADHAHLKFSPAEGHLHPSCSKDVTAVFSSDSPVQLDRQQIQIKANMIEFTAPMEEVRDWDDRQKVVKWVDAVAPKSASSTAMQKDQQDGNTSKAAKNKKGAANEKEMSQPELQGPRKKKVTELKAEPEHTLVEGGQRDIAATVSALCGYSKFKSKTSSIAFQHTMMFQSRKYEFSVTNKGQVGLSYHWRIELEDGRSLDYPVEEQQPSHLRPLSRQNTSLDKNSAGMVPEILPPPTPGYIPFSIEPFVGTINAGKKKTFHVRFAPLDIGEFKGKLICSIPNLDPNEHAGSNGIMEIQISGSSEMPCVHFELPESDYLSGNRRDPTRKGPGGEPAGTLDPNAKVLEFSVTGVGFKTHKSFDVINPTKNTYSYSWQCLDLKSVKKETAFKCLNPKGQILSGHSTQMGFEFRPSDLGVTESFWRFSIPGQKISLLFLLVGTTSEPTVRFERSHLSFRSILVGEQSHELIHLENDEDFPLSYSFDAESIYTEGRGAMIGIMPIAGVIPPKSRAPLDLFFTAPSDKEYNFNLICRVKHRREPLMLNVKAEGFSVRADLVCESASGQMVKLTANGRNEINLKQVEPNEQAVRSLQVSNPGKYAISYKWTISSHRELVSISPEEGELKPGQKCSTTLAFLSAKNCELRNCILTLEVKRGPNYQVALLGKCVAPLLVFSAKKVNFGSVFLARAGMKPSVENVQITNSDSKPISVQCLFEDTDALQVGFQSCSLDPGQSASVTLTFSPHRVGAVEEVVAFFLNGLSTSTLQVKGEGITANIEAADGMKLLNFGSVKAGKQAKKQTTLTNHTKVPVTFDLCMSPTSPRGVTLAQSVSITPSKVTMKPNESVNVVVKLCSNERIPAFSEEVYLEMAGSSVPVFSVSGSVVDQSVRLDTQAVPFGAVVARGESRRRLLMTNDGDIGVYFNWDVAKFKPDFSIVPSKGYIAPGMDLPLEIAFQPSVVNADIRYSNLTCNIEGGKPLKLTLTGVCAACPPTGKELVQFQCSVRETDRKMVSISNKTGSQWVLTPVIEGEFFQGPDTLVIDAGATKPYNISYKPFRMTSADKKHLGSVFFALPDGSGLLYNLQGAADPPKPVDTIIREVPSKQPHTELIPVSNWEKTPQRFKVIIDLMKPDKLDPSTQLNGLDYLDVPGLTKRDYKLNFYSHKEGNFQAKVTFVNEKSGEYVFFFLNLRVSLPGVMETVELETPCRHPLSHSITLANPLPNNGVTFYASCPCPEILMPPQFVIAPESSCDFNIEYLPLRVEETSVKLVLNSTELGSYTYDLVLRSLPPRPEKPLFFRAPLGSQQTLTATFLNYSKAKCEYTIKIEQPERTAGKEDFSVEKTIIPAAPGTSAGTEVSFDVTFEPSCLGDVKAEMRIFSQVGGDYLFMLHGTATTPKPQGPFSVKAGGSMTIPFKNIFHSQQQFVFSIDNPAFTVKGNENLKGKKSTNLHVAFEGNPDGSKMPCMGKLMVSCPKSMAGKNTSWSFYIKGTH